MQMPYYSSVNEARSAFHRHRAQIEDAGISWEPGVEPKAFLPMTSNGSLAQDAQLPLTTDPNAGIPQALTFYIDPTIIEVLFAPTEAANIMGEVRKGDWLMETAAFPIVEHTGEVSSYGDFADSGRADINYNFPQRQSYLFQTFIEYGDREVARIGLARINYVAELNKSAANTINRFLNNTYFVGVSGLANYGLINDPHLAAAITPATKAAGGTAWFVNGKINATPNEVYNDILNLFADLVSRTGGIVKPDTPMVLALFPQSSVALQSANTFNVNVSDLLAKSFKNLTIMTATQYGQASAINPIGIAGGNMVQLIAKTLEGQETGYCAFNEKMRNHRVIPKESSFRQKKSAGTWGTVIRVPMAFSTLLGV